MGNTCNFSAGPISTINDRRNYDPKTAASIDMANTKKAIEEVAISGAGAAVPGGIFTRVFGKILSSMVAKAGAKEAMAARDALAKSLQPLKGKAPATVTGGYNIKTGEAVARACGSGKCAEDHVLKALGGNKSEVQFTQAVRPRTGEQVPICPRCEASYGREPFPPGTLFKTDELIK